MKNGGKNKSVAFIFLFSVDPEIIIYPYIETRMLFFFKCGIQGNVKKKDSDLKKRYEVK